MKHLKPNGFGVSLKRKMLFGGIRSSQKYGVDILGWWTKKSPFAHRVGCWKSILAGLEHFKSLVNFKAKNGSRVHFLV